MKYIRVAVLFLAVTLFLCGCADKDNWHPAGMKRVENGNVDYTLYVPEKWTVDLTTHVTSAYFPDDRSNISLTAFSLTGDDTYISPADYWARYVADCKTTFTDFRYLSDSEETTAEGETAPEITDEEAAVKITFGGMAANKYRCSMKVTGQEYRYTVVVCIRGGYAYMLTYTALPDYYETHTEEIDNVILNFSFD